MRSFLAKNRDSYHRPAPSFLPFFVIEKWPLFRSSCFQLYRIRGASFLGLSGTRSKFVRFLRQCMCFEKFLSSKSIFVHSENKIFASTCVHFTQSVGVSGLNSTKNRAQVRRPTCAHFSIENRSKNCEKILRMCRRPRSLRPMGANSGSKILKSVQLRLKEAHYRPRRGRNSTRKGSKRALKIWPKNQVLKFGQNFKFMS